MKKLIKQIWSDPSNDRIYERFMGFFESKKKNVVTTHYHYTQFTGCPNRYDTTVSTGDFYLHNILAGFYTVTAKTGSHGIEYFSGIG